MRWLVALSLLWAGSVFAAEGGNLSGGCDDSGQGEYACEAFYLNDGALGDNVSAEFDLKVATRGYPHHCTLSILTLTGCSSPTLVEIMPRGSHVTGGCGASPSTGCVDLRGSPLTTGTVQGDVLEPDYRYLDATIGGTTTGCTDVETALACYWRRP